MPHTHDGTVRPPTARLSVGSARPAVFRCSTFFSSPEAAERASISSPDARVPRKESAST